MRLMTRQATDGGSKLARRRSLLSAHPDDHDVVPGGERTGFDSRLHECIVAEGLTAAQAIDYLMVVEEGSSADEWAAIRGVGVGQIEQTILAARSKDGFETMAFDDNPVPDEGRERVAVLIAEGLTPTEVVDYIAIDVWGKEAWWWKEQRGLAVTSGIWRRVRSAREKLSVSEDEGVEEGGE